MEGSEGRPPEVAFRPFVAVDLDDRRRDRQDAAEPRIPGAMLAIIDHVRAKAPQRGDDPADAERLVDIAQARERIGFQRAAMDAADHLAMLLETAEGQKAARDFDLLAQVAKHKDVFFRSAWANYDIAKPGTLRLMPDKARIKDLRTDYKAMEPMMFDETPLAFDDILAMIETLQAAVNE